MAAWLVALLLAAPGVSDGLERAFAPGNVQRKGLSICVGRAGQAPFFEVQPGVPRIPASNQKVVTAAVAIHVLGEGFRFRTVVARKGEDLVVVGDGDPNLSGRFFGGDPNAMLRKLAADVKSRGVAKVRDLYIDASKFDATYVHPDWPSNQLDRWYSAPVAALVFNDSCWDITVTPGTQPGAPAGVEFQPSLLSPPLLNKAKTSRRGDPKLHFGHTRDGSIEVRGTTSQRFTGHLTVRDPVGFFAAAFKAALIAEGIAISGEVKAGKLQDAQPVVIYRSTLKRTLPVMLTNSQNLYAECLFKRFGDGTFEGGGRMVVRSLKALKVPSDGVVAADGSGLARTNRLTARALYGLLNVMRDEETFVSGLATGGTGTLRRRYRELGDRVRAKTGTIRGVSTLSGYVIGAGGRRYVFVVLANNNPHARKAQDMVVKVLARAR
ncbi:MAG: D-alanyl-D-alanine carboxypeptidase/D-alanyl-D-alanine endopeptidase [Planctomycetota bacterium]|jgi:D-alanyl-D-alanine carboxypeptidase/D-alanyl-D-alanine-endopeptidase (penicillin-binding protein 4)